MCVCPSVRPIFFDMTIGREGGGEVTGRGKGGNGGMDGQMKGGRGDRGGGREKEREGWREREGGP